MEVTVYEDPACSWCWAFEPVATTFAFELGHRFTIRHVMGGLRDRPAADVDFIVGQWRKAEAVSGMPFDVGIWERHTLRTTFLACRAVKAAVILSADAAAGLLRRLREAFYTEQARIDDANEVLRLAAEIGIDKELLLENLSNGRAETLFERDRAEASGQGFGFPTLLLHGQQQEEPVLLQGSVPYEELLQAAASVGVPQRERRPFRDTRDDWKRLFAIHPRLSAAELQAVTGWSPEQMEKRVKAGKLFRDGAFYTSEPRRTPVAGTPVVSAADAATPATEAQAPSGAETASKEAPAAGSSTQLADSAVGGTT